MGGWRVLEGPFKLYPTIVTVYATTRLLKVPYTVTILQADASRRMNRDSRSFFPSPSFTSQRRRSVYVKAMPCSPEVLNKLRLRMRCMSCFNNIPFAFFKPCWFFPARFADASRVAMPASGLYITPLWSSAGVQSLGFANTCPKV